MRAGELRKTLSAVDQSRKPSDWTQFAVLLPLPNCPVWLRCCKHRRPCCVFVWLRIPSPCDVPCWFIVIYLRTRFVYSQIMDSLGNTTACSHTFFFDASRLNTAVASVYIQTHTNPTYAHHTHTIFFVKLVILLFKSKSLQISMKKTGDIFLWALSKE